MNFSGLLKFECRVGEIFEFFGAPEGFQEEWKKRILQAEAVVAEELGKPLGQLPSNEVFDEKGNAAVKEVKEWFINNYKFPGQSAQVDEPQSGLVMMDDFNSVLTLKEIPHDDSRVPLLKETWNLAVRSASTYVRSENKGMDYGLENHLTAK